MMDKASYMAHCATYRGTSHVEQWGGADVWKVLGKVFVLARFDDVAAMSFKVSRLGFEVLSDLPGHRPAPYLASRGLSWIQADFAALPPGEAEAHIRTSYALVTAGLSARKRREAGIPAP